MLLARTLPRLVITRSSHRGLSIVSYWKDVWRTGSLSPTNPLFEAVNETLTVNSAAPDLSAIQPHHVLDASNKILREQQHETAQLLAQQAQPSEEVLNRFNRIQAPMESLVRIAAFLGHISPSSASSKAQWDTAMNGLGAALLGRNVKRELQIYQMLRNAIQSQSATTASASNVETTHISMWAAQEWIRNYEERTGCHLPEENKREYRTLTRALDEVGTELQGIMTTRTSKKKSTQAMRYMYHYLGIQNRRAQLLGFPNHADQVLATSATSVPHLQSLHKQVGHTVLPYVAEWSKPSTTSSLDGYLGNPNIQSKRTSPDRSDQAQMLRLEDHVTLEGALQFLRYLFRDLMDVDIVPDDDTSSGWNGDVRLFHVFRSEQRLGSFYLDPFQRPAKLNRPFMAPLSSGWAAVTLDLKCPAWDSQPVHLMWDDLEVLFHEMGHVVQSFLARRQPSLEFTEFLPTVRSLCLAWLQPVSVGKQHTF